MLWIVIILICFAALWMFLSMPNAPRRSLDALALFDYAHRGLWNDELPENSMPAFRNAVENGFGIELDVHLTADRQLVVFHDNTLTRMCGTDGRVEDMTLEELRRCRLNGTEETIPTFAEVLAVVDGRVPLIVELKHGKHNDELCRLANEALVRYGHTGMWCIESFHPVCVAWFRKHAPAVIRGQLAYGLRTNKTRKPLDFIVSSLLLNVLSRPDFVAYRASDEPSLPMRWMRACRPSFAAWTVRSQSQMDALRSTYHMQIFEGFVPKR